jgi:hypothetical protein
MREIYINWSEYHQKIELLAAKVYQSDWDFNQIICIAKGGLRVGDILCRLYEKPLAILFATSYGGAGNRVRGEIAFSNHLAMTSDRLGNKVLLVDDLVDSGVSLQESLNWLNTYHSDEIEEIRTGVIWYKSCSQIQPGYYVDYLPDDPWIHQPFEIYEQTTPAELAQRYQLFDPC